MKSDHHILTLKPVEPEDFPELESWWEVRGQEAPPTVVLPDMGVIASNGDYRAAAWLYLDTSGVVSFLHWFVTNPENTPSMSRDAAAVICEFFAQFARDQGYKTIVTTVQNKALLGEAEALGWVSDNQACYQAAKPLG